MAWQTIQYREVDDLFGRISELTANRLWSCRGQAKNWGDQLHPKLDRIFRNGDHYLSRLHSERQAMSLFIHHAPSLLSPVELGLLNNMLSRWAVMQHHGAPTRLLDWSFSPWVALYFACCDHKNEDGDVWLFDRTAFHLMTHSAHHDALHLLGDMNIVKGLSNQHRLLFVHPPYKWIALIDGHSPNTFGVRSASPRYIAQQSCFTICGELGIDHAQAIDAILADQNGPDNPTKFRVSIRKESKPAVMKRLAIMNITAASLFPGVDGVGRYVQDVLEFGSETGLQVHAMVGGAEGEDARGFVPPPY